MINVDVTIIMSPKVDVEVPIAKKKTNVTLSDHADAQNESRNSWWRTIIKSFDDGDPMLGRTMLSAFKAMYGDIPFNPDPDRGRQPEVLEERGRKQERRPRTESLILDEDPAEQGLDSRKAHSSRTNIAKRQKATMNLPSKSSSSARRVPSNSTTKKKELLTILRHPTKTVTGGKVVLRADATTTTTTTIIERIILSVTTTARKIGRQTLMEEVTDSLTTTIRARASTLVATRTIRIPPTVVTSHHPPILSNPVSRGTIAGPSEPQNQLAIVPKAGGRRQGVALAILNRQNGGGKQT
ncbi:uncharacterized protein MELLADRAFT_105516 [Melampsora larici-populina 98AG31]|uniref:Uncharacterized protein n=1 Tax=Melampsora larici-populina (strain 98AG31 / pathotype 3-4-7) TaxID=747676 RepID=F4RIG9_MELLP|nr:uncharacterized protein MELLADRAFT_105516 [Melampsora larici-populina 98AG31]EGG07561.1 hypothetical protein MELLADRAFT_105516 [Melampsora larici-populina 98AG31]